MAGERLGRIPMKESVPKSSQLFLLLFPLYSEISSTRNVFSQKIIVTFVKPIIDPELDIRHHLKRGSDLLKDIEVRK